MFVGLGNWSDWSASLNVNKYMAVLEENLFSLEQDSKDLGQDMKMAAH